MQSLVLDLSKVSIPLRSFHMAPEAQTTILGDRALVSLQIFVCQSSAEFSKS